MNRKFVGAMSAIAVMASTLPYGVAQAAGQSGSVTISMWDLTENTDDKMIISDFEKAYPDIHVKLTTYSVDGIKQQEKVAASSGSLPDVYFDWGGSLASYYQQNGLALNLNPYLKSLKWDKRFSKLAIQLGSYGGKFYEVPMNLDGMVLFYRKDIFAKYHLQPPTTFAALQNVAKTLKTHGITPFGGGGLHSWYTMRFMDALIEHFVGSKGHDALMSLKGNWNTPAVVQAYVTLGQWAKAGYFPKGLLSIDETQDASQFEQGKAAMVLEGPWFDGQMVADKFPISKVATFEFPEGHQPNRLSSFVQGYMVSSKSSNADAAVKFLNYFTSNQNLSKYKTTLSNPFGNVHVSPPASQPNAAVIQKELAKDGGFLISDQYLPQQVVQDYWQSFNSVVAGTMTPQAAAKFMEQQVTQYKQSNGG